MGGRRLPTWRRQVDRALARPLPRLGRRGRVSAPSSGFGLVTIITSATTYAVALLCALSGDPAVGLLVGGTFGLVRALPSAFMGRVVTREQLWRVLARVERAAPTADRRG